MATDIVRTFVSYLGNVLLIAILIRVVVGWLIIMKDFQWLDGNPLIRLVWEVTEPILRPIRRFLPAAGGLDFSPWIAGIFIYVVSNAISSALPASV
jgi:YggT family protein